MNRKKTILLVDDEVDFAEMIKFQLMSHGYHVIMAQDGIQALERLKTVQPDLIIMDINMPRMGGLEFYSKICTEHGRSRYPVLVLTARANLEKTFQDIRVDAFLSKPFEISDLMAKIESLTSQEVNPLVYLVDFTTSVHIPKIMEIFAAERYRAMSFQDFETLRNMTASKRPSYIFMEYMQKGMSGEEFIRRMKEDPVFGGIPLVVYSYTGFAEYGEKSLKAGADKYLGKPESYEAFIAAIKELEMK